MKSTLLCLLLSFAFASSVHAEPNQTGAYLVKIAGCADCHSVSPDQPFAGGYPIATPFGMFYSPNISPDPETGIGKWTRDDFRRALREGKAPDGHYYYPVFPYRAFSQIRDEDIDKMWDYLNSQKPIVKVNRPPDLSFPFNQRWLMFFWQKLFFDSSSLPNPARSAKWNRGAYLVEAFSHCTECHTPRNFLGGLKSSEWMGGSEQAVGGHLPPNITPAEASGLGAWSKEDWQRFLASGRDPQGHYPAAEMAQVILNTSSLEVSDRDAIIEYLMSLKPVGGDQ